MLIKVYFVNQYRYNLNLPPFERAGLRYVRSNSVYTSLLDQYFKGPGATERISYGWIALYNGFTGYSKFELTNGVANIYLTGICNRGNNPYTIANLLTYNFKQFPEVQYVKIYDQNGQTQDPTGLSDSEPVCLSPSFTPSPTPTFPPTPTPSPTPTRTPTATPTPTQTRLPSPTPLYVKINIFWVSQYRYDNNLPPFERAGVRYVRSSSVYTSLLDEYFKGPGFSERYSYGWIGLYNGFTGYSKFEFNNGIANIYLQGTCDRGNATYTIANLLIYNFKQFPEVKFVKIYDENGTTQDPTGLSDSIPACLQP